MIFSRENSLKTLESTSFDLLVVGGGATGCGIALDAASRGLSVALVEQEDFSSGTSSRSTKLVHGGVRYLEQAALHLDSIQYHLVTDALGERSTFFRIAPHLTRRLPILTPLYRWIDIPYFYIGLKLYDWIAGKASLGPSHYHNTDRATQRFPMLNKKGLKGAVAYYDGQFDDARMNLLLATTAVQQGACVLNYVRVKQLVKEVDGSRSVTVEDLLSKKERLIKAKVVINATGPFTDSLRQMDDPNAQPIMALSAGSHILLDKSFCPPQTGLLIPRTKDGRLLFLLPWEGGTLAGTTERRCDPELHPKATEEEISFILDHLSHYFNSPIKRSDVKAAWTGIRPLVGKTGTGETAKLSRDHLIEVSTNGLVTITGGKWTTYRKMAEETLDTAIEVGGLAPKKPCWTDTLLLIGAEGYSRQLGAQLAERHALPLDIARHLARAYGSQAEAVLTCAEDVQRLEQSQPYIAAEVTYCVRYELAQRLTDVLARRTRLAFLDVAAAHAAIDICAELMAAELNWSQERIAEEKQNALSFLDTMTITA